MYINQYVYAMARYTLSTSSFFRKQRVQMLLSFCFYIIFGWFFSIPVFSQDYIRYQKIMNQTDEEILSNDLPAALKNFDLVYQEYDFIYARHCIKALQVACVMNDSVRAEKWLSKCFLQGVPTWLIRNNGITKKVLQYPLAKNTWNAYDSLHSIYQSKINTSLLQLVDSLLLIDIRHTRRVNDGFVLFKPFYGLAWLRNNKKEFRVLKAIIDSTGFPGEKLIGVSDFYQDSVTAYKSISFYGPSLFYESSVYIMLVHYFSSKRNTDIRDKLYKEMLKGNLPPWQYAGLNDFQAEYGKKKYGFEYYYAAHTHADSLHLTEVNPRREKAGLNTYNQQERNMLIMRERRKNKKTSDEIILE